MGLVRLPAPLLLLTSLIVLGGCVGHTTQPAGDNRFPIPPEVFLDARGAPFVPSVLDARLAEAAYILVGEEHPNACHHAAQAAVIRRLITAGIRPVIGLEMVAADHQDILDAVSQGKLAVADLPTALDWSKTWGFPFALYAPIFSLAENAHLPLFALNVPTGLARKVAHQGLDALTPLERSSIPGAILPPAPAQLEKLQKIQAMHAAMLAKRGKTVRDAFTAFVTVQSLWDTQMASRARYAHLRSKQPVVILAGAGHVEGGYGIARRLAVLDPGAPVFSIMAWPGEGEALGEADAFFVCPEERSEEKMPPAAGGMMPPDPSHREQGNKRDTRVQ